MQEDVFIVLLKNLFIIYIRNLIFEFFIDGAIVIHKISLEALKMLGKLLYFKCKCLYACIKGSAYFDLIF